MRNLTPFLPGISHQLYGSQRRSQLDRMRDQIDVLRRNSLSRLCELFGPWLPVDLFKSAPSGLNSRNRTFPLSVTFWAFLCQVLNPGSPCRETVRRVQAWYAGRRSNLPESGTGGYCQARKRMPLNILKKAHSNLAEKLVSPIKEFGAWNGHQIHVIDGTGVSMPDTPNNRKFYSQPSEQKPGCGFPVMKIVGVFCLQTGALLHWVQGQLEEHECRLFMKLLEFFKPGDIVLADRGLSGYGQLAALHQQGVNTVMRAHQCRKVDWRKGQRLGRRDRLVQWKRPYQQWSVFGKEAWGRLPKEMTVRLVEIVVEVPGYRTHKITLVTTLLDLFDYPAQELGRLYFRRWAVELFYRDIKQTMMMDVLRCKSPELIEKELFMHAIAYNLIRALICDIADSYQVSIQRLSFKGTLDALRQWQSLFETNGRGGRSCNRWIKLFYEIVVTDPLIKRPDRSEPRVLKRRLKKYRLLTKPRNIMEVEPE